MMKRIDIPGGRPSMIKTVIRIKNDYVMVFDEDGEQIPEYQGHYRDVKAKILADAPAGSVFNHWFGHSLEPEKVTGEIW
jgi:hypothetical protein